VQGRWGHLQDVKNAKKQISGMERTLFLHLETGYRLSKATLVVELSRSLGCFVVESDLETTQLQTAITKISATESAQSRTQGRVSGRKEMSENCLLSPCGR
jgi:hypothetical protein